MRITTLGSLAVDGRPVRGERLATVVRVLIDARGRVVSTAALVEAVWDGTPPDDALGAVQALISRVRRLGLPVTGLPGGYRVPADTVDVDSVVARDLVHRGRAGLRAADPGLARRCADEARALFASVPDLVDPETVRLFADVVALRAEAALQGRGAPDEADLRLLAGHVPPHEPSVALLVRILAAHGRDAEALDVLERLRTDLSERYGTDPSPLVAEVHVALLRGELPLLRGEMPLPGGEVDRSQAEDSEHGQWRAEHGQEPDAWPGGERGHQRTEHDAHDRPRTADGRPSGGPGQWQAGYDPHDRPRTTDGWLSGEQPLAKPDARDRPRTADGRLGGGPGQARAVEPAPRTAASVLPKAWRRSLTTLVGREGDVSAVVAALDTAPLVTIVAVGGAGKTRLATEVARQTVATGRRVYVVELAGLRASDEVLPAVLAALGATDPTAGRRVLGPPERPDDTPPTRRDTPTRHTTGLDDSSTARRALGLDDTAAWEHRTEPDDTPTGRRGLNPDDSSTGRHGMGPEERLRLAVRELDGLVVLDNCEHLLEGAAAAVAELLEVASPELSVLATSRAPLSLPGEVVHRLRTLADDEALALLEARTRAGGAMLAWHGDRALELCHRLDNLPLALELAAARLRHMPIEDVLAGLSDRFGLLDDALRGLPDRHASLWAMVDWSRELLNPEDRSLLQRLAVIPAPFTAETAASVAAEVSTTTPDASTAATSKPTTPKNDMSTKSAETSSTRPKNATAPTVAPPNNTASKTAVASVRRGLATLVEQSLLTLEEGDDGRPRYRMLETVREYGEVRLDAAGERDAAMAGLVAWARVEAVAVAAGFLGDGQLEAFARCTADQDNLMAALRWSIAHEDDAASVDVATTLLHLWTVRGLHPEAAAWSLALFHEDEPRLRLRSPLMYGSATGRPLPNADRTAWTCVLASLNGFVANVMRLYTMADRALRTLTAERPDEMSPRVAALASMLPGLASPDPEVALRDSTRLIAHPDPYVQAFGLLLRSTMHENLGVLGAAMDEAEEAYNLFRTVGDHWGMGMTAQGIGTRGEGGADEWLRRSERHMELVGATQDVSSIRIRLDVQLALGGDGEAEQRLRDAAGSAEIPAMDVVQARLGLAQLECRRERYQETLRHAESAMAIVDGPELAIPQVRVVFRVVVAVLYLRAAASTARARELLTTAGADALSAMDIPVLGSWALGGAALAAHRGDVAPARELWTLGVRLGANVAHVFQGDQDQLLMAALGAEEDREPALTAWRKRPVGEATDRIRELMSDVLGQTFLR